VTLTQGDLDGVHARVGRLEVKVDDQQEKLGDVAEDTAWIKGYLETNGNGPKRRPMRDVGMVAGGGGIVGVVLFVLERLFGTGGVL
jgi:hypothetical protein